MASINAVNSQESSNSIQSSVQNTGTNTYGAGSSIENSMAELMEIMAEAMAMMEEARRATEAMEATTEVTANSAGISGGSIIGAPAVQNELDTGFGSAGTPDTAGSAGDLDNIMMQLRPIVETVLSFAKAIDPELGNELANDFNENLPEGWDEFDVEAPEAGQESSGSGSQGESASGSEEASGGGCGCGCSGPGCSCGGGCGGGAAAAEGSSGGGHGSSGGSGGMAGALGEPRFESEAPAEIIAGLGSWVDGEGNVKAANTGGASGHAGHEMGTELNVHEVYEAALAAGIDADAFVADFVSDDGNYNPGQTTEQKYAGALTVLNDMTAAVTMGGLEGDGAEIAKIAGAATNAALSGDAAALRQILEGAGGNVENMSDDMLLNVWSTNSHMYNHAILNVDSEHFALTHLRSLNDNASDGTAAGTLGFYNDKGQYPQWDAQEASINFLNNTIGDIAGGGGPRSVVDYAGGGHEGHQH